MLSESNESDYDPEEKQIQSDKSKEKSWKSADSWLEGKPPMGWQWWKAILV